jgi:hypothetical protein
VRIGEIRSAVALVEKQLGGSQKYSEVNATQTEVNVFVVRDGRDFAYLVRDGVVQSPTDGGEPYTGKSFSAPDIAFAPNVLDKVVAGLGDTEVVAFSVTPKPAGGVDYVAVATAPSGEFRVLLGPDGSVLSTS